MTRDEYVEFLKHFDFGWPKPEAHAKAIAWAGVYRAEFVEAYEAWKRKAYDTRTKTRDHPESEGNQGRS